ncbi:asparaginase [Aliishimia ponticola]|uniref:Asparaginase n=1 Tax=Aliishimia ponticola TaxID=2499833 RepID=A0A4S4NGY7_9RHOB|nr:asparaginase [Aliishimia ponticola]THH35350.1 asparaginase [Aliishimia ponticola]
MQAGIPLVELWRGPFAESVHTGHAVICDAQGDIVEAWGDPTQVVLPRSSAKMLQALPLIESGAADAFSLSTAQLALSCASHQGARIHVDKVSAWLGDLGLGESDLRCGPQQSEDIPYRNQMICADEAPCQLHNNCSGKHAGFLTLAKHLGAGPEYIDPDHPVQLAGREAWERMTDEEVQGYGIDGCSAPNFATSLHGMARAMAKFATAAEGTPQQRLVSAMTTHPELVAGETRACTNLMRAMDGRVAIKTGAEGFFIAIIPEKKLGVALKIADGTTRASECAIAAILVKLGVLDVDHPETRKYLDAPILNRRGIQTGWQRATDALR